MREHNVSVWSEFGKKINSARSKIRLPKGSEDSPKRFALRANDKKQEKTPRQKYVYQEPEASVLLNQRAVWDRIKGGEKPEDALGASASVLKVHHVPLISVIVTTYEPVIRYFEQTHYRDERIRYYSVPGNRGEASLINDAAHLAAGNYLCTVDVGDLLTKDALYEVFLCIMRTGAEILYTDEDHCDAAGKRFDRPNRKPDFNKDYLLSNNYMQSPRCAMCP